MRRKVIGKASHGALLRSARGPGIEQRERTHEGRGFGPACGRVEGERQILAPVSLLRFGEAGEPGLVCCVRRAGSWRRRAAGEAQAALIGDNIDFLDAELLSADREVCSSHKRLIINGITRLRCK
jgi:hypothetical protein